MYSFLRKLIFISLLSAPSALFAVAGDADNDGIPDAYETNTGIYVSATNTGTNPNVADTDGDGLSDGVETNTGIYVSPSNTGTNPLKGDTDGDGLKDSYENNTGNYINPLFTGTNPNIFDTDGDGTPDGNEIINGTNPANAASKPTVLRPVPGDADNDGIPDSYETNTGIYVSPTNTGTNPNLADTDGDSVPDGMEVNLGTNPCDANSKTSRPNIIYILADDLGPGDIGCFWQNQRTGTKKFITPGLDAMAAEGAKLTHHYVGAPICASSRSSLLQGRHQGHSDIRDSQFDYPLPRNHTLAGVLKTAGYYTVHIGKAGLVGNANNGYTQIPDAHPLVRGFDRFFGYLGHTAAHEHYPRNGTTEKQAFIYDDWKKIDSAYVDLYTSDAWTGFAKKTIIEETQNHPNRPFFIYLAYDTPHFISQFAPTANYPTGFGSSGGIQWTGAPSYVNTAINDPSRIDSSANQHPSVDPTWPIINRRYASMIRRMDDSVSDILQTLRDQGVANNTLVVFTSDNGAESLEIDPQFFQSYGGFEGLKRDIWEGGIRTPTIAWWPSKLVGTNQLNNIREITRPCANYDWMATFAELAKAPIPAFTDGTSMVPTLTGQGIQSDKGYLYFEFNYGTAASTVTNAYSDFPNHGNNPVGQEQAIRVGNYMGVRTGIASANDPFRIYNVVTDVKQAVDLAPFLPDLQQRMKYLGLGAHRKLPTVIRPYDTGLIPAIAPTPIRNGLKWKSYEGYWPWLPDFRSLTPVSSGENPTLTPTLSSRANNFGLSFETYLSVPTSGAYVFQTSSDANVDLWVDEGHLIDNDFTFATTKTSSSIFLSAGLHPIRLYYRHQTTGTASLTLSYSGPGITMQPIPPSSYFVDGQPTILVPDTAVTRMNVPVTVDVLANDSAQNPLTLQTVGAASNGTTSISNGKVIYTPTNLFVGFDNFTYGANDGISVVNSSVAATVFYDNEIWMPLDEGQGTSVKAYGSPTPPVGVLVGAADPSTSWINGGLRKALTFDGIDDQVNFPGLSLPTGAAPRTFTCFIKTSASSVPGLQTLFSYGATGSGQRFSVRLNNSANVAGPQALRLEVEGGSVVGFKPINDGVWHHIAVVLADQNNDSVLNLNETKLYVDGSPDSITSIQSLPISTGSTLVPCLAGSNHDSAYHLAGNLDEIRIFPRSLTANEVSDLSLSIPNLLTITSPTVDSDGDGMTDVFENIAGTDRYSAASVLRIASITQANGLVTLTWPAVAGRSYQVEESTALNSWQSVPNLGPVIMTQSTTSPLSVSFPQTSVPSRFLRLRVTLTPP